MRWFPWRRDPRTEQEDAEVATEQPKPVPPTLRDMWVKPALGGVVVECPKCNWDWYSTVGGTHFGLIITAVESHITSKHGRDTG